jgi:AbrB family looped-hinge helix DNA binding protein
MTRMAIVTVSSKGQIVIPATIRDDIKEGDRFVIFRKGDTIVLHSAKGVEKKLSEDEIFAKRTEAAWKRYDQGKFKTASKKEFLAILDKM